MNGNYYLIDAVKGEDNKIFEYFLTSPGNGRQCVVIVDVFKENLQDMKDYYAL